MRLRTCALYGAMVLLFAVLFTACERPKSVVAPGESKRAFEGLKAVELFEVLVASNGADSAGAKITDIKLSPAPNVFRLPTPLALRFLGENLTDYGYALLTKGNRQWAITTGPRRGTPITTGEVLVHAASYSDSLVFSTTEYERDAEERVGLIPKLGLATSDTTFRFVKFVAKY